MGVIIATRPLLCNNHLTPGGEDIKKLTKGLELVHALIPYGMLEATVQSYSDFFCPPGE